MTYTFRSVQDKLQDHFPVPGAHHLIEHYFTEPWYGHNGMDVKGWRMFDVAVNRKTVIKDLDIWAAAGYNTAFRKTVTANIRGGQLNISFPHVASGEAVISAIAISTKDQRIKPAQRSASTIKGDQVQLWMDTGDMPYLDSKTTICELPPNLFGAEWLKMPSLSKQALPPPFKVNIRAEVYIALDAGISQKPVWMNADQDTKATLQTDANGGHLFKVYRRHVAAGSTLALGEDDISAQMYIVVVLPSTPGMEPATDLKPTVAYKTDAALTHGGSLLKDEVSGKKCITFKANTQGQLAWAIATGVGDSHELRIKYFNPTGKRLSAKLMLTAADGTIMKEAELEFGTNLPDKWKVAFCTTGTSIHAGNYKVKYRQLMCRV